MTIRRFDKCNVVKKQFFISFTDSGDSGKLQLELALAHLMRDSADKMNLNQLNPRLTCLNSLLSLYSIASTGQCSVWTRKVTLGTWKRLSNQCSMAPPSGRQRLPLPVGGTAPLLTSCQSFLTPRCEWWLTDWLTDHWPTRMTTLSQLVRPTDPVTATASPPDCLFRCWSMHGPAKCSILPVCRIYAVNVPSFLQIF